MGSTAGQPAPEGGRPSERRRTEGGGFDINRVVSAMIGREKGNAKAVIRHLVREGRRYRRRLNEAETELAARPPKLAEGQVILSVEESKRWNALKDITLTPEQVKESLKKKDDLEAQENARAQASLLEQGGKDLGIRRPKLLAEQISRLGLVAESRDVEEADEAGKRHTVKRIYLKNPKDQKDAGRPLSDVVEKDLKDYQPSLMADEDTEESSSSESTDRQRETAVTYPAQRGARGRAPVKDPVVRTIGDKYKAPSEVRKQQQSS